MCIYTHARTTLDRIHAFKRNVDARVVRANGAGERYSFYAILSLDYGEIAWPANARCYRYGNDDRKSATMCGERIRYGFYRSDGSRLLFDVFIRRSK